MIREAESQDREQLSNLYRMLVPNSKKMNVLEEQIEKIRMDPANFLLVYEVEGALLGTLTLNICLQAMHGTRPYGLIENIVVHEDHRSNNIGQSLLKYAEEYCSRCIVTKSCCSAIPNESGPINFLNAKDMTAQSAKALKNICNRTFRKT
ncbi:GNAT family N-acetyltransferase [Paenibacillus favisporus]|uniref:GNAT family N-acetyltransferase n=1 Tax=Paenibacillus favisporus TaxID=221028 RepID=UPI0013D1E84F|nr:GNAT family N-acetyltransferase [Paenibacillus favisporus]